MEIIKDYIDELKKVVDSIDSKEVERVLEVLIQAYRNNKSVFIVGNGGSASTASHFACDLGKGTLGKLLW